jgi:uncharacterized protein (DUF488 family)
VTIELCTIGVYGFDADHFFAALRDAGVDLLVDIRRRRGVRGTEYAFANARRLAAALTDRGLAYAHVIELAPTTDLLHLQHDIDRGSGTSVRARTRLAPEYVSRYEAEILGTADLGAHADRLAPYARPALLCVETDPSTCHRSLAAGALAPLLRAPVLHLRPA